MLGTAQIETRCKEVKLGTRLTFNTAGLISWLRQQAQFKQYDRVNPNMKAVLEEEAVCVLLSQGPQAK